MTLQRENSPEKKIVFIVGHPRSGTTWLMWLLGQHPAVAACNHAGFFHALEPLRAWWKTGTKFGKTIHVFTRTDPEQVEAAYERVKLNHLLEQEEFSKLLAPLTKTVFERIAEVRPGAFVAVEQTPENMLFADTIQQLLPEAHFLHIIRDPRAVAASMRKAVREWADPADFPYHPVQIARSWLRYMEVGKELAGQTSRYKSVRYEDLRAGGGEILGDIFNWLEIDTSPEMCARFLEASSIDRMRSETRLMPKGFFQRGQSQSWKQDLKPADVKTIEYLAAGWMDDLGYEAAYPRSGRKPRRLLAYERGVRLRNFTHGGFLDALRRLPGGGRITRLAGRWFRSRRRTQAGMEE